MKKFAIILLLLSLFSAPFVVGKAKGGIVPESELEDSLRSLWSYTEALQKLTIDRDSTAAKELLYKALRQDSTFAPAWFALAAHNLTETPSEAVEAARKARDLDTTNRWYERCYGQTLLETYRYDQALDCFRRLMHKDVNDPDNYRIVAALYQLQKNPYMAIATLDSAEFRFGRIAELGAMKRQLLIATNQRDRALKEAKALVEEAPYDPENHTELAMLYGMDKQDSLALVEFNAALSLDPTNFRALAALSDYHDSRRDYLQSLAVQQRLFALNTVPLTTKTRQIEAYTSDRRFYGEHYTQIGALISTLAIHYPQNRKVVDLYAGHLIAGGEIEQALALYKSHLDDTPAEESYYQWVIDIEGYLKRIDSVVVYVDRAVQRFPDQPRFYLMRGNIYSLDGKQREANEDFQRALRYADTDSLRSDIWGTIGDSWFRVIEEDQKSGNLKNLKKNRKECFRAYDQSLKYNPDNALVLNNYAYHLALEKMRLEEALIMAERAVFLSGNNPTYLDTQAWVLYQSGRYEEARKLMKQAIALEQNPHSDYYLHYGDILQALGERFLAETYWRKALEKGHDAAEIEKRLKP